MYLILSIRINISCLTQRVYTGFDKYVRIPQRVYIRFDKYVHISQRVYVGFDKYVHISQRIHIGFDKYVRIPQRVYIGFDKYVHIPQKSPIDTLFAIKFSISASSISAVSDRRKREVPCGTVGGRMARQ